MEEDYDQQVLDAFDSTDAIAEGRISELGKILKLHVSCDDHLDAVILKSDTATVTVPELDLEECPGTGRFTTIRELLVETRDKITGSVYKPAPGTPQHAKLNKFLNDMELAVRGDLPLTLVLDDPLANCQVKRRYGVKVESSTYTRTWEQNEELGLPQPCESAINNEASDENVDPVAKLADLLAKSNKIVAFTGAGISVESGVPAYRGGGDTIWAKYNASDTDYNNFMSDEGSRERFWQMKTEFWEYVIKAQPNPAHTIFGYLHQKGKLLSVITQNIDDLHQKAGVPYENVLRLHGSEHIVSCTQCKKQFDRNLIHQQLRNGTTKVPRCDTCQSVLKPDTIFFGQALEDDVVNKAKELLHECDLMIVMGTSLVVHPANKLPRICLTRGVPLVIINHNGTTQYDKYASVLLDQPAGATMAIVREKIGNHVVTSPRVQRPNHLDNKSKN